MKKAVSVAALGLLLTCIGGPSLLDSLALRRSRSFTDAELVDSRIMVTKGRMTHEVRYRFSLTGLPGNVTRTDFLRRSDLWSTLSEKAAAGLPQIEDDLTSVVLGVALLSMASVAYRRGTTRTDDFHVDQTNA
jgi:hypothetical protein